MPTNRRTRLSFRLPRMRLFRKSELINGIEVKGSGEFLSRTKEALDLLSRSRSFPEIRRHIEVIKEGKRSGMKAYAPRPTFVVGKPTWSHSAIWYAGAIAHDAYHSLLYQAAREENKGKRPSPDAWTGEEAEKKCLAFQRQALEELQVDLSLTAHVREWEKHPTYQGRHKGWLAWWDYWRRWW